MACEPFESFLISEIGQGPRTTWRESPEPFRAQLCSACGRQVGAAVVSVPQSQERSETPGAAGHPPVPHWADPSLPGTADSGCPGASQTQSYVSAPQQSKTKQNKNKKGGACLLWLVDLISKECLLVISEGLKWEKHR